MMVLNSCVKNHHINYEYLLKEQGIKKFLLDKNTGPISLGVSYYENNKGRFYFHFNSHNIKFLVYDYDKTTLKKKLELKGKYPIPSYATYYNLDTIILIYDSTNKNSILLLDSLGRKINLMVIETERFNFRKRGVIYKNYNPILFKKNKIFYTNTLYSDCRLKNRYSECLGGSIDCLTQSRENFVYYPDKYYISDWGYGYFTDIFHCFNDHEMIVSFPASEYIYIYNLYLNKKDSSLARSSFFNSTRPIKRRKRTTLNDEKSARHYASTPSYGPVYYDQYKKVYYRFAGLPKRKRDFDKKFPMESIRKPQSIIILDKDFKKIGETFLGDDFRVLCTLITPDGLLLNKIEKDETYTTYKIFKLVKNE